MALLTWGFVGDASADTASSRLGKIVVSATKTPHTLGDVPVQAEVITREELLARNVKTLQDALVSVTGARIKRSSGSWGDKGKIEFQGLEERHTLVLVDGQRLLGGHNDSPDLQQISVESIERIEILKGPSSSLYGSDAVGGVINIITRSAPEKPSFSASLLRGSQNTSVADFSGGLKTGGFGAFIGYAHRASDGVEKSSDRYLEHLLRGTFSYVFSPNASLSLKPFYSRQDQLGGERLQERYGMNTLFELKPNDHSNLKLRGSLFTYEQWTGDRVDDYDLQSREIELSYSSQFFDRHTVTLGYQLWNETRNDRGKRLDLDQTQHSLYIQDEMDFSPLTVLLGARYDTHDDWGEEFNPRLGLMYRFSPVLKLKVSVGTAFKAPSLLKLYGNWMMGPFLVHANPDLKPEKSIGYQVGLDYTLSRDVDLRLSFFRNEIDDLVTSRIDRRPPRPWNIYWENVEEAVTQGVEFSLAANLLEHLAAHIGYTWLDTENKVTGKELLYKPAHRFTGDLRWSVPSRGLALGAGVEYTGERYEDEANRSKLDGFWLCHLNFTKALSRDAEVFLRIDNLFGEKGISDEYDRDGTEFLAGLRVKI